MNKYAIHSIQSSPAESSKILADIKHSTGFVPHVYGLLANSPNALTAIDELNTSFVQSSFTAQEREIIALATSVENRCAYCVAGHTAFGLAEGINPSTVTAVRQAKRAPDERLETLRHFTSKLVRTRGAVTDVDIADFAKQGFMPDEVFELLIGVAAKVMTNFASKLAAIPLDEAFAPYAWSADTITDTNNIPIKIT